MDPLDVHENTYTVIGFYRENFQRYADKILAATPQMAEQIAQMRARDEGGTLAVCSVLLGDQITCDAYATYVEPSCTTQQQMEQVMREWGYLDED